MENLFNLEGYALVIDLKQSLVIEGGDIVDRMVYIGPEKFILLPEIKFVMIQHTGGMVDWLPLSNIEKISTRQPTQEDLNGIK